MWLRLHHGRGEQGLDGGTAGEYPGGVRSYETNTSDVKGEEGGTDKLHLYPGQNHCKLKQLELAVHILVL